MQTTLTPHHHHHPSTVQHTGQEGMPSVDEKAHVGSGPSAAMGAGVGLGPVSVPSTRLAGEDLTVDVRPLPEVRRSCSPLSLG